MSDQIILSTEPLSRRVLTGLAKLGIALRSEARSGALSRGMSPTQGEILAFVLRRPGASLSDVAEALAVTRPTVSDAIDTLARKGFIEKRRAERDPRMLFLTLTEAGRTEAELAAQWPDALLGAVDTLTPEEQEVWFRGLVKMLRALLDSGAIQAARMCTTCAHYQPTARGSNGASHHCTLLDLPLPELDLRIDCTEHAPASS